VLYACVRVCLCAGGGLGARCRRQAHITLALRLGAPDAVLRGLASVLVDAVPSAQPLPPDAAGAAGAAAGSDPGTCAGSQTLRVSWRPGVRVRSSPDVAAAVLRVARHGSTLSCRTPDANGWAPLADGGGYVHVHTRTQLPHDSHHTSSPRQWLTRPTRTRTRTRPPCALWPYGTWQLCAHGFQRRRQPSAGDATRADGAVRCGARSF
jgi:hypothetical protein